MACAIPVGLLAGFRPASKCFHWVPLSDSGALDCPFRCLTVIRCNLFGNVVDHPLVLKELPLKGYKMNSTVWHSIKKKLRISINPVLVKVWVDPLSARLENGVVQLTAPNEFVMNWVREHLLDRIRDAAREVLDKEVGVTIDLRESASPLGFREYMTDVHAYYAAEDILRSINNLTEIVKESSAHLYEENEKSISGDGPLEPELEPQSFDTILDAVLEAFAVSFRELMTLPNEHSLLARRALYYLCFRYGIPAEEVALNMDCTVSEVRQGASELEDEISSAIDNGEDLDELLLRIFQK